MKIINSNADRRVWQGEYEDKESFRNNPKLFRYEPLCGATYFGCEHSTGVFDEAKRAEARCVEAKQ